LLLVAQRGGIGRCLRLDGRGGDILPGLPREPGEVYGDSAFGGARCATTIRAKGGVPAIVETGTRGGPAALARLEAHNTRVRRVCCRIEKVFGAWKRCYSL